jgi:hypothetical protein
MEMGRFYDQGFGVTSQGEKSEQTQTGQAINRLESHVSEAGIRPRNRASQ